MLDDAPWYDHQHHSSLSNSLEEDLNEIYRPNIVELSTNSTSIYNVNFEKNLSKIEDTIPLDI